MLHLPAELQPLSEKLTDALLEPVLAEWPTGDEGAKAGYTVAHQAERLGRVLIPALHEVLQNARIAYLFREDMKAGGRRKLGQASKVGAKVHFLTEHDFILELNWSAWRELTSEQRIALVDHELEHCDYDFETSRFTLRDHDVEEFGAIVRRWGLWQPTLERFGRDVSQALAQTELFASAPGGA